MSENSFKENIENLTSLQPIEYNSVYNPHISVTSNSINSASAVCHMAAYSNNWWTDIETGEYKDRNQGEMIALMHSELSEALEGVRKNMKDDKLPHRPSVEVELADCLIRIFDYAGRYGLDLGGAMGEK